MGKTGQDAAIENAEALRSLVEKRLIAKRATGESLGRITLSLGVATLNPDEDADGLITRTDKALYRPKRQRRNRVKAAA